ncbi:MAG: CopG family transcriptional regulator [Erysipelotrichia bacterium]|nr:CopG family transcriptional regulator [Erysipelotrichia bacterium]
MPQTTTMTIRVPIETMNRLADVSRSTERSKSYLANKAIEEFLDAQEWQILSIEEAVKEADVPDADFQSHANVVARMKKKVAAARKSEQK